jgi:adenosylcobinamide-phosphate synthase
LNLRRLQERPNEDRMLALVLALASDLLLGEPPSALHPVVWLGRGIDALERMAPEPQRRESLLYGGIATLGLAAAAAGLARVGERIAHHLPPLLGIALAAALLKPAFAVRMLLQAGSSVRGRLEAGDLDAARRELRTLVSRDASHLSGSDCAAAVVESLAENLADSIVGPWLGFAIAGLPGAWLFRSVNTLDSRWGYHGRYELLGRVAARLDDILAWVPARLSAILLIVAAPAGGGDPRAAMQVMLRDRHATASPNAGWTMAAIAGALGCRLEKPHHYVLNAGARECRSEDIPRAQRIVGAAVLLAVLGAAGIQRCAGRFGSSRV